MNPPAPSMSSSSPSKRSRKFIIICLIGLLGGLVGAFIPLIFTTIRDWTLAGKPLAEGRNGVVVGTTGTAAIHAGLDALKKGGTAADAAVTTALAQVAECAGAYVSYAGIFGMVYYEADAGKVY